jgi:MFS family permease
VTEILPQTPDEREAFIQRHLRFNLLAFFTDGVGWWLGMSFYSVQTLLPYFVKELGGGGLLIGLIPAVMSLGYQLPQLFAAPFAERRTIQKHMVLRVAWIERAALGLLAPFTFLYAESRPGLLLTAFFLLMGVNALAMGWNMPAYSTLLTKTVPLAVRGRFWGISGAVASLIALAGAGLSAWLLKSYGLRLGFTACFVIGFVLMFVTVLPLGLIREPEASDPVAHPGLRTYLGETRALLRHYPDFLRLILTDWLFAFAAMAAAFYTVYAVERFGAGPWSVGRFTMTLLASGVVGGFLWGHLSDRSGNRRTLLCAAGLSALAPLLALVVPTLAVFPAVFFLSGLASSAFELGMFNITLEFAGETKVATFQGARALMVVPARVLFPLLGGALAKTLGYGTVLALSAIAAAGAVALLFAVPDPRHHAVGFSPDRHGANGGGADGHGLDKELQGIKESDCARVET